MSEIELTALIERYLNGEMTPDERTRFEILRRDNIAVDNAVNEHQEFTSRIKQYGERLQFENLLNDIHNEIDVQALKDEFIHHPSGIVRLWRNHHSKISVAASIAIFAVLGTLFFTGYYKTQSNEDKVQKLTKIVAGVKQSNDNIAKSLNNIKAGIKPAVRDNYHGTGTGFALSSDGYLVTNFHVIKGADSVHIQNMDGDNFSAKIVSTDPANDIAILKISDDNFKTLGALPYGFRRSKSDLGEEVYTYGFAKDDGVYSKGYLSSGNGFNGDSVKYQLAMDVNYGNSGGPVIDSKGNVIGIVSSREAGIDGSAFAIKAKYLFKAIQVDSLDSKLSLPSKNTMANLSRTQQLKKLQSYIFMVKVYN